MPLLSNPDCYSQVSLSCTGIRVINLYGKGWQQLPSGGIKLYVKFQLVKKHVKCCGMPTSLIKVHIDKDSLKLLFKKRYFLI
jgi:hypothetical protein